MLQAGFARAGAPESAANPSAPAATASAPVRVDRIEVRGNRWLQAGVLQGAAAPYLHRDLTDADIEALRAALSSQFTDRGYINSGVILDPEAPYHDGLLCFLVFEGRITEVHVSGLKGLRPAYVVDRVRGPGDEILNADTLRERFQWLSEDPLFAKVSSRMDPGAAPGDTVLDVEVQRARPYSLSLVLNNYRPPEIGEKAYDVSGEVHDLTGFGDVFAADVSGPVGFSGGVGYALSGQVPVNSGGSLVSLSAARINTVVTEELLSLLDVRSTIDREELKVTQPLWRSLNAQFNLSASIADEKESTVGNFLFSLIPGSGQGVTRSVTARLMPDFSYHSEQQFFGVKLTLLHANLLGSPAALDFDPNTDSEVLPEKKYFVWSGQLHHLLEFRNAPFELESRATVQRTNSRIADLHLMEIGGINSVRGYRENDYLASNVTNVNADLRWLALRAGTPQRPDLALGTFVDWASGHDADETGATAATYSSCGLTLRLKLPHFQADLAYGRPLTHPSFVTEERGSWQDHGIHVQIMTML
jgi:hemolysin activation/secretion protein